MKHSRRSGFTLVELLIVIVVIGVLSAMMMLSSTEAVTSAKASNIVSDLRNLKTAALALYVDSQDSFDNGSTPTLAQVAKYMNGKSTADDLKGYSIASTTNNSWFVGASPDTTVGAKLKSRASSVGLYKDMNKGAYDGGTSVYMLVK